MDTSLPTAPRRRPLSPVLRRVTRTALPGALLLVAAVLPLGAASADTSGVVDVQVTPALPGVRLAIGGVVATTDGQGRVQVALANINNVAHSVHLAGSAVDARTSVSLLRVSPQPHTAPHVSNLAVALEVRSEVRLRLNPGVTGIAPTDVTSLRLHSVAGQVITVDPQRHRVVELETQRAMLQHGVLRPQDVTWTVDRVVTGSGAVVTTDRHRFFPLARPVWSVNLVPVAGTLHVQTIPATPGVQFSLGGQSLTTGAHGRVTSQVSDLNAAAGRITLVTPWADQARVRLMHVGHLPPGQPGTRRLLLALTVSRPVQLRFLDEHGDVVPPSRVNLVRLNESGRILTVRQPARPGPVWLPAAAAHNTHGRWTTRQVSYSVRTVLVDGANAVFNGRQHFKVGSASSWPIRLSVFPLSVTVTDALFGQQTSSGLQLRLPDGKSLNYRVDSSSATVIPALARGLYQVQVDAAVIGKRSSVLVSQAGAADLRVVTALDVGVVLTALVLIAGGLIAAGRAAARRAAAPTRVRRAA